MKKKEEYDSRITTDDFVDFACGLAFYELIAVIIGLILIIILP